MPTAPSQSIPINLVRHLEVATTDNTTGATNADPLSPFASPNAAIAVASVNPVNSRVIDITPGTQAGSVNLVIGKTPAGTQQLVIPVTVTAAANIGSVVYVTQAGEDTPKGA